MITVSRRRSTRLSSLIATLLSGVLAFQLMLAGGGMLCLMPAHSDAMASMRAMQATSQVAAAPAPRLAQAGIPVDQPCDGRGQPAQCVTMAACAPGVLPAMTAVALAAPRISSAAVSTPETAPLSQTSAPELPPPRA